MASFFSAAARLVFKRHPTESRMTEQQAQQAQAQNLAGVPPVVPGMVPPPVSSANGAIPVASGHQGPIYVNPKEDTLTFFRLMLGIQTSPYLGFTISSPLGTRPAANIGLYARIVHSEQKAKDSFKVFSIVINACYFLQIVIAAALTALGAARASSGAVTAFGALNTVIAGFLTFLKGSGLPGRFKYYGNEWKKIREFIEQRERDFMRPGHELDVYEVVETVERMYNNLKADIELNTPDSYTSVTNQRRVGDERDSRIGGIDVLQIESLANKLKSLEDGKPERLASGLKEKAHGFVHQHGKQVKDEIEQFEDNIEHFKGDVVRNVQSHGAHLKREVREQGEEIHSTVNEGKQVAKDRTRELGTAAREYREHMIESAGDTRREVLEGIDSTINQASGSASH
ncbi:hypothetical protein GGS21DRAFT_516208 [Xylaria nigripes]|nr:hypothetical protein GGS21DRAFT_516208 [Xylaria nigripes]